MADETLPEEWRVVADFPDYEVSSRGKVRRATDLVGHGPKGKPYLKSAAGRILSTGKGRYATVGLWKDGKRGRVFQICVLVCRAFNGEKPSPEYEVAHNNGKHRDDRPSNLRWSTHHDNMLDMEIHGTRHKGENHANHKLTQNDVREIRHLLGSGFSEIKVTKMFGVSSGTIGDIRRNRTWRWLKQDKA